MNKKTSELIRKTAETQRLRRNQGEIVSWHKGKTAATDIRLANHGSKVSKTIQRKIAEGTWHNSFAKSRRHIYKDESFDGKWELKLAMWFDENDIVWVRNRKSFLYGFDKPRRYTPDFFLPIINCYVEVKGWKTPKDEAKWSHFSERLIVLSGSDLQSFGIDISVRNDWKTLCSEKQQLITVDEFRRV